MNIKRQLTTFVGEAVLTGHDVQAPSILNIPELTQLSQLDDGMILPYRPSSGLDAELIKFLGENFHKKYAETWWAASSQLNLAELEANGKGMLRNIGEHIENWKTPVVCDHSGFISNSSDSTTQKNMESPGVMIELLTDGTMAALTEGHDQPKAEANLEREAERTRLRQDLQHLKEVLESAREKTFQMWIRKNEELHVKHDEMNDVLELLRRRAARPAAEVGHYPRWVDDALEKPAPSIN